MWTYLLISMALLGISGCCTETTLERNYGKSWAFNQEAQIANPEAALAPTPATGLSPNASATTMGAYNKSFAGKKTEGGTSTTVNLGGVTTGVGGGGN